MSELSPAPRLTTAQRRQDVWLAAGLLVAAVLSAWLGSTASVYGTESAPFSWALAYAVALTVPIAFRRRVPIVVLVVIAVAFFTGVSLRIPEVYVGNVTLFIAMFERDHPEPLSYQKGYGAALAHLSLPYPDIAT